MIASNRRPTLDAGMDAAEFLRWYWLKSELVEFARHQALHASGSKRALQDRIAAFLSGGPTEEDPEQPRRRGARQLTGALNADSVIPPGQRCSQHLRTWFVQQAGPTFGFSGAVRDFLASVDGTTTLGDALAVWQDDATGGPRPIDAQFEYNRFTRAWWAEHPAGDRADLLTAWRRYRDTPADQR